MLRNHEMKHMHTYYFTWHFKLFYSDTEFTDPLGL